MPTDLTQSQKRRLRAAAQRLEPRIKVGRNGLSESFIASVDELLANHELIKVRFDEFKDRKDELSGEIAERTDSAFITRVGHVSVFYRPHADPAKRAVKID